jgi:acyl-[acyl-carrier-protein]-phospholipid O-acyltransferase/long-chain-fatty-acid--[acyl-carrier-protein] ligase
MRLSGVCTSRLALPAGALIVAPNHLSLWDGPLVACLTDRPVLFGVDPDYLCRQPWRFVLLFLVKLGFGDVVPLDADRPFAWRRLAAALHRGEAICVFPEGAIARGGQLLPIRPGVARLARMMKTPVLPVRIERAEQPRIAVVAGAQIDPSHPDLADLLTASLQQSARIGTETFDASGRPGGLDRWIRTFGRK